MNALDLLLGASALTTTAYLSYNGLPVGWVPLYLFVVFFVFCNVVRIRRPYEYVWTAVFLTAMAGCLVASPLGTAWQAAAVGWMAQALLVVLAVRNKDTRGVGHQAASPGKDGGAP